MNIDAVFYLRGLGFIASGALFWLIYFNIKDRYKPEPKRLLVLTFILGIGSAVLAIGAYLICEMLGCPVFPSQDLGGILIFCLLLVGPIEEGMKFLVARVFVFRWKHFDEPIDGMVYASIIAIGFASMENVLYLSYLSWPQQLIRTLTSPLTHSLFAIVWGFGTSKAYFSARTRTGRFLWQAIPLMASMLLHGLYDFFLLALNATYLASGIVLILWVFLISYARHLTKFQKP